MASNKFHALGQSLGDDDSDQEQDSPASGSGASGSSSAASTSASAGPRPFPPVPPGEHRLQSMYCLWFSRKTGGKQAQAAFDQQLRKIGTFATCEQFWELYSHLISPGELQSHSDFHLFKEGIKPMWEDEANRFGGKWIVRLRKGLASRCWENLIMAMLGEQFMVGEEICGAVVSIRFQEDIISIWNRSSGDQAVTTRIRDTFRRVLNLPPGTVTEYKAHNDSIKDHSSFRNTETFR